MMMMMMMMMCPTCRVYLFVTAVLLLLLFPLRIWSFHGLHHYYSYHQPYSHQRGDVYLLSFPVYYRNTHGGDDRYSWSLKAQTKNSSNAHHHQHGRQQSRPRQFLSVNDVLDDYIKTRNRLKPYQVAAVWNRLGKALQQSSRNKREQRNFWVDHETNLKLLVVHTQQLVDDFNGQSTATVTHSLAKLLSLTDSNLGRVQSLWNALLLRTAMHVKSDGFNAQELSNILWAYAKADKGKTNKRLLDALAKAALLQVDDFSPQGLANIAWAYASINHDAPLLFDAIAKAAEHRIDDFKPQELSNTAWAYATLKFKALSLLDTIARKAQEHIDDFNPQDLSNTAWAFASLNHKAPSMFDAIATTASVRIDDFKPQELSNTAWAFAKLNHDAPPLFDAIAIALQKRIIDFKPQVLSNTAWAFAKLNHDAPPLFDAIAIAGRERIDDFKPQVLSNTAWAFAKLNHDAPLLFDAIAIAGQERIDNFKPQELSNTAWAFATLNQDATSLFKTIARKAQEHIDDFNPQDLSNTAWAFATLNHEAPKLFEAVARTVQMRIVDFKPQELSNTAWAFAVLNVKTDLLTDAGLSFTQTLLSTDPTSFSVEELCQLHQFHLCCTEKNTLSCFSDELSSSCRDAFVSRGDTSSQLQNDVVASLAGLQDVTQVQAEFHTKIGYSLDAAIVYQGSWIGLEVDGPFHFVGRSKKPNGNTALKHRQLRVLEGWKLVSIPYWEWNEICDAASGGPTRLESNKQAYLHNLLDRASSGGLGI